MTQVASGMRSNGAPLAARIVSVITFPPVVALVAFLLLIASLPGSGSRWTVTGVALTFGVIWPVAATVGLILRREGIERPRDRLTLLALGVLGYVFGTAGLLVADSPLLVTLLMFCYATNTAILLAVNVYWRASAHAMGIAGPTMALVFGFGAWGALLSLLLPAVGWSRIRLKAHNIAQIAAGAGLGFVMTGLQISVGLRLF